LAIFLFTGFSAIQEILIQQLMLEYFFDLYEELLSP